MNDGLERGMGWIPDHPDLRDYTLETKEVREIFSGPEGAGRGPRKRASALPAAVDLRGWCSPVEDQGRLGSCTANAGAGVIEYYDHSFIRLTRTTAPNLFIFKHDIKYVFEDRK